MAEYTVASEGTFLGQSGIINMGTWRAIGQFSTATINSWNDNQSRPSIYVRFSPTSVNITSQYQYADAHRGERVYIFTIYNGVKFYIQRDGGYDLIFGCEDSSRSIDAGFVNASKPSSMPDQMYAGICRDQNAEWGYGVYLFWHIPGNPGNWWTYFRFAQNATDYNWWRMLLNDQPLSGFDDPYYFNDNDTPTGGYGPFDYTSEQELPPSVPSVSAADVGFISLWNPTAAEMKALADWLWTGNFAINAWRSITASPMECILSVGVVPITPTRYQESGVDTKKEIEFVGSGTDVNCYKVTDQYYVVDMGSLHISGMSNSNMDYAPYAKASIFLPYCGTYALDVDEIMDADVALEYHIDIYTGACVAYLTISGKVNSDEHEIDAVMYQFTGNCLATIPVTSVDHSQFIQSLLFMGASVAATVATAGGGAGTAAAGADLGSEAGVSAGAIAATAGSAINTVMSMKPNVLHSGNLSSTAGFLGGQKPYITMTWSNLCRADDEYKVVGMPLNKSGKLSDFAGLTVISGVHLDNIKCTDTERIMIEQALYKGVIVPEGGVA